MVHPQFFSGFKELASWVMYKYIQSILVICYYLILLVGDNHDLQLATRDVYEAGVYIFIYDHIQS
jgi:hypothetical protein